MFKSIFVLMVVVSAACAANVDAPTASCMQAFENEALNGHNFLRGLHNAKPLNLKNKLTEEAGIAVDIFVSSNSKAIDTAFQYADFTIQTADISDANCAMVASMLTNSIEMQEDNYDYVKGKSNGKDTSAFTQLIWKATTSVGFGLRVEVANNGKSSKWYIVTKYDKFIFVQRRHSVDHPGWRQEHLVSALLCAAVAREPCGPPWICCARPCCELRTTRSSAACSTAWATRMFHRHMLR